MEGNEVGAVHAIITVVPVIIRAVHAIVRVVLSMTVQQRKKWSGTIVGAVYAIIRFVQVILMAVLAIVTAKCRKLSLQRHRKPSFFKGFCAPCANKGMQGGHF